MAEKKAILNLRLRPDVRNDFAIAAKLRGASMSGLLHQYIVKTIREEKEASPHEFRKHRIRAANGQIAPVAVISSEKAERERIRRELDAIEIKDSRKRKTG